jgi:hypothetical protein
LDVRCSMFIGLCDPSCWFWSRAAQALAPRVGYCDLEFVCDLVLVIWIFIIAQFVPDQSFFYGSDWKLAADGPPEAEHLKPFFAPLL